MAVEMKDDFEYVTQFFGFTPKAFLDGIYNAINDYIKEFFKEMGKVLEEEFAKDDAILGSKIRQGCNELISNCYKTVDNTIDKIELYILGNIFCIPSTVLLPEDQVHSEIKNVFKGESDDSSKAESELDKEISELKTGILKELHYRQLAQDEQKKLTKVLLELKRLEEWFNKICDEVNHSNLKETIDLVSKNSVEIMDLLESQKQINN